MKHSPCDFHSEEPTEFLNNLQLLLVVQWEETHSCSRYVINVQLNMEYEWDDAKNQQNQAKHGIDFYDAVRIFMDNDRIEWIDDRKNYQEKRYRTVGTVMGVLLTVIYTPRNKRYRLISARRASKHERETYYHKKS